MNPWEIHPMLVHFPIAFLLGSTSLDVVTLIRPREALAQSARGLLWAGVLFGWLATGAGLIAFFTVPAHTEAAHVEMYWHLALAIASLILFTWTAIARRRRGSSTKPAQVLLAICASALLILTGHFGASLVYHGGAGVRPELLTREIRQGHSHGNGPSHDAGHSHDGDQQARD